MKIFCILNLILLPFSIFGEEMKGLHEQQEPKEVVDNWSVLKSPKCSGFMLEENTRLNELFSFGGNELISFICNPIERAVIIKKLAALEDDYLHLTDPCVAAYEETLFVDKARIIESLSTQAKCESEVADEAKAHHDGRLNLRHEERELAVVSAFFLAKLSLMVIWSDLNLKENIQLVGTSPSGINVYTFQYRAGIEKLNKNLSSGAIYSGVMAQELEDKFPEAIIMGKDGFYAVDYSKIDVDFHQLTHA